MILVFHSNNFRDSSGYGLGECFTDDDALRAFNNTGYQFVAQVHTDDIERAYVLTNHIDRNWTENEDVQVVPDVEPRSSSVGDIFVTDREIYIVARFGFNKLDDLRPHEAVIAGRASRRLS